VAIADHGAWMRPLPASTVALQSRVTESDSMRDALDRKPAFSVSPFILLARVFLKKKKKKKKKKKVTFL
jgi:hypothetical protein